MIGLGGGRVRSAGHGHPANTPLDGGSVMSVRTRLLLWLVLPLLQVILVSAVLDYRAVDRTVDEAFDRVLLNSAVAIGESVREGQIPGTLRLPVDRLRVLLNDPVDALDYRVVGPRGEHLAGNPALPLPADDADPTFYDMTVEGRDLRAVRIAADTDAGNLSVVVAETQRKRRKLLEQLRSSLLIEDAIMLGLTIAVCLLAIRMALSPLSRLAAQLSRREPGDLTPLGPQAAPAEVRPLTAALDTLFGRLAEGRDAQRRFVENAAHQLRTPLAGLKGQIELALGEARRLRDRPPADDTDSAQALAHRLASAQGAVDRLARLSHQLLTLSRADQSTRDASGGQVVALADLIDEVVSLHIDAALARGQDLGAETQPLEVPGSAWQLRELLSNLVDNAIRYTPAGGRITVRCGLRDGRGYAEVEDNGPGIAAAERRLVFERFWRSSAATGQGSGLGLAIVREIAQSHGAQVSVEDPPEGRGAVVRVSFPPVVGAVRGGPGLRSGSDAPAAGT
ncbi:MAG: sensor histidine kinase N-terminal domain-containing protein [Betaproteobacteria bacterium]|nr:sensor histidine kinase N-terminal domain-containing protein [Betaproteobacteria bacterium]